MQEYVHEEMNYSAVNHSRLNVVHNHKLGYDIDKYIAISCNLHYLKGYPLLQHIGLCDSIKHLMKTTEKGRLEMAVRTSKHVSLVMTTRNYRELLYLLLSRLDDRYIDHISISFISEFIDNDQSNEIRYILSEIERIKKDINNSRTVDEQKKMILSFLDNRLVNEQVSDDVHDIVHRFTIIPFHGFANDGTHLKL